MSHWSDGTTPIQKPISKLPHQVMEHGFAKTAGEPTGETEDTSIFHTTINH
jgi:hypothetical protein